MEEGLLASQVPGFRPRLPGGGIGGARHQYVQLLVRQIALGLGYGAALEEQIPGTRKRVDFSIRGRSVRVACEIPISTKYQEEGNIRKCLAAGFDFVVSVALDRATLRTVESRIMHLIAPEECDRVKFLFPEELAKLLETLEEQESQPSSGLVGERESFVRGYRVSTRILQTSSDEARDRNTRVASVIVGSLRRRQKPAS